MTTSTNNDHQRLQEEELDRFLARWETDVVLADGGTVKIRPILPQDAELIVNLHGSLSQETIYFRFFAPLRQLSDALLQRFVNVDYTDRMAFVAFLKDSIIAVSRYDRLPGRSEAEVAFLVSDAHQGRGLGTIMLEMLAARASEAGISRFVADTLPENQRMLRVFHDAGYVDSRSIHDGVVRVVFDIAPTPESVQRMYERERRAVANSVGKILSPRSIAVVGASTTQGSIGNVLFRNILDSSFEGPVYPINPHATSVSSVKAYSSLLSVPDEIDLAIIVVPADEVLNVVTQAGEKNVSGLVIISSGFSDIGPEGTQRERELVRYARQNGMRIVGPNCMGVANTSPQISLNATLATHPLLPGKASLIAHSGALGLAIVEEARRRGIGLSTFISSGNRADVSGNDLLHYWEQDQNTNVILLYLESFGNPRTFVRIARRLSKLKPIIAVKAKRVATTPPTLSAFGFSNAGDKMTEPTGILGVPLDPILSEEIGTITVNEAVDAMFSHTGVLRVNSLEELFSLGNALSAQPTPMGPNVVILANNGGPTAITQDSLERAGLKMARLAKETQQTLAAKLPTGSKISNPVELPVGTGAESYAIALKEILADENTDGVIVLYVPTVLWSNVDEIPSAPRRRELKSSPQSPEAAIYNASEVAAEIAKIASAQQEEHAKPILANFLALSRTIPALHLDDYVIPSFPFPELAAQALGRMWEYQQWRSKPTGQFYNHNGIDRANAASQIKSWLTVAKEITRSEQNNYPISKDVFLQTDQTRDLFACYDIEMMEPSAFKEIQHDPQSVPIKLSVIHDMIFGPFITMQLGGLLSDLLAQRAIRVLPLRDLDAQELIASIPGSQIFNGYRDIPKLDLNPLVQLVSKIGQMVENHFEIAHISINPLIVNQDGCQLGSAKVRLVDWAAQANYLMRGLS